MNKDINDTCADSSYQFDDFLDDNILLVDHSRNFLAPAMRLSCYEEEVVAPQHLTVNIRNQQSFLSYDDFHKEFVKGENQIFSFDYSNGNEQINISACDSFGSEPQEYDEGDKEGLYEQFVGDIYLHTHSFGQIGLVKPLS